MNQRFNILVLEDQTDRISWFFTEFPASEFAITICNDVSQFNACCGHFVYDLIFLDHDLGEMTLEAHHSIDVICNSFNINTPVVIHSLNPVGAEYMYKSLMKYDRPAFTAKIQFGKFNRHSFQFNHAEQPLTQQQFEHTNQ